MKFKIDENLPLECAETLRSVGHDAIKVIEEEISGAPDAELFAVCRSEERILITLDLDFADIRVYPPAESTGIVVLRIQPQDKNRLVVCLHKLIPLLGKEPVMNRLWIVEEDRIRIHEGLAQ